MLFAQREAHMGCTTRNLGVELVFTTIIKNTRKWDVLMESIKSLNFALKTKMEEIERKRRER